MKCDLAHLAAFNADKVIKISYFVALIHIFLNLSFGDIYKLSGAILVMHGYFSILNRLAIYRLPFILLSSYFVMHENMYFGFDEHV